MLKCWWNGSQALSESTEEQHFENSSKNRALNEDTKALASFAQTALLEECLMKKLFICTAALALFAATPAFSASDNQHGDKHQGATQGSSSHAVPGGTHQNGPTGAMTGRFNARTGGSKQNTMTTTTSGNRFLPASGDAYRNKTAHSVTTTTRARTGDANTHSTTTARSFSTGASMRGNTTGQHAGINSLRHNLQASHQYHNGNYNAPQGYQSRHWSYGERLPRLYFASNYWIGDYLMFGLFAPPTDLIWVRVGDDALLIDRYSGDIVQVDYNVFY